MTVTAPNVCLRCTRLDREALQANSSEPRCSAFDRIPDEIWRGDSSHRTAIGDEATFDPVSQDDAEWAEFVFGTPENEMLDREASGMV